MQELIEIDAVERVDVGRYERSDQSAAPTEQLLVASRCLSTKVLMVGR
jgi:hypothetical protein